MGQTYWLRDTSEEDEACWMLDHYIDEISERMVDGVVSNDDHLDLLVLAVSARSAILEGDYTYVTLDMLDNTRSRMEYNILSIVWNYFDPTAE